MAINSDFLVYGVIFGLPAAAVIWFLITLVIFIFTDHTGEKKHKSLKIMLIVSGIIAGTLVLALIGLFILMSLVIVNM